MNGLLSNKKEQIHHLLAQLFWWVIVAHYCKVVLTEHTKTV